MATWPTPPAASRSTSSRMAAGNGERAQGGGGRDLRSSCIPGVCEGWTCCCAAVLPSSCFLVDLRRSTGQGQWLWGAHRGPRTRVPSSCLCLRGPCTHDCFSSRSFERPMYAPQAMQQAPSYIHSSRKLSGQLLGPPLRLGPLFFEEEDVWSFVRFLNTSSAVRPSCRAPCCWAAFSWTTGCRARTPVSSRGRRRASTTCRPSRKPPAATRPGPASSKRYSASVECRARGGGERNA